MQDTFVRFQKIRHVERAFVIRWGDVFERDRQIGTYGGTKGGGSSRVRSVHDRQSIKEGVNRVQHC